MTKIGWDDQGDSYTAWDRIRDERRAERETRPTRDEIEAARTPNGGWTKETLAKWGVSCPPPKGWREKLERGQ